MDDSAGTMLPPSDEAFAFDERQKLGEFTSIACSRARSSYLAGACTGQPQHLPDGGHVPQRHGRVAAGVMT